MADNKTQNDDILQEIPDEQLPALRDLFKGRWPYALHAYYWLDNYIDWKKRNITKIKFYCPEGRWDDGTFIATEDEPLHTIFLFSLEKSCNRLRNALSKTSKIRWTQENFTIFFLAIHEDFQPTIMNELAVRGITVNHRDIANMWWIPKADALKYDYTIPGEVYLAALKEEDVDAIDSVWPHRVAMDDILEEIPDEQLPALRDLFKGYWPFAMHAYYWVDNYIEWKKRNITNIRFYCPEGRWDDGTFIAIEDDTVLCVFVFSLDKSNDRLRNALSKTSRIKWDQESLRISFRPVHEVHKPVILNELNKRGITLKCQVDTRLWWISIEDALNYEYDIPSDVYLAPLKKEDVDIIEPVWPHRAEYSAKIYLTSLITANGGFGLYSKLDGTLYSWVLKNNFGGMGILQTAEQHKRKGYGRILAKHFSKYWAQKGCCVFCFIVTHNNASVQLFKQLGYKQEHGVSWIHAVTK
ncbi:uncharacterized protein CBL_09125 [Carabus blaptoides fortunei]